MTFTAAAVLATSGLMGAAPARVLAADATYHHLQVTTSSPSEGVKWYGRHLDCTAVEGRADAVTCGGAMIVFVSQPTLGTTQGTGVNHISFSLPDLAAKMAELEAQGVYGNRVRLQRFPDGSTFQDVPGWFKTGFIFDPWGTRIGLIENPDRIGFHHVHLSAADPAATLRWYRDVLGGEPTQVSGRDAVRFGEVLVLASAHPNGSPATTAGRAIDHIAFVVEDLDSAAADLRERGVVFDEAPAVPMNARSSARRVFVAGPDNVRLAVVERGWAGVVPEELVLAEADDLSGPYETPRTPWGEPDLQGVWTSNAAHGIPLERPRDLADVERLTPEQAAARRERGTLSSIWGYEREWRDTTLGYVKSAPSRQVAMVVDPPDGRVPPRTEEGQARAARGAEARRRIRSRPPVGPEDLSPYVRCITKGVPAMMMPGVYNNGLQIVQGPRFVVLQIEMIHEARVVPTEPREPLGDDLKTWLGDPQGRWEGETLVIETTNFNGRAGFRGSSRDMKLIERYTRLSPDLLEYEFTIDDPTVWTRPWTGRFAFERDDAQYELVEYSCHEGNYGMTNILSGARALDRAAEEAAQ